jgi:hypothetical protein
VRLHITEPCYIECDGPVLIEPIERAKEVTLPAPVEYVGAITGKPTRKPMARRRKTCERCGRSYNGVAIQRFCSGRCKATFYREERAAVRNSHTTPIQIPTGTQNG